MKSSHIKRNENESSMKYPNNRRGFLKIAGASLLAASTVSVVQAAHDDDDKQVVTLALGSAGLVFGQSLRITLTNLGKGKMNLKPTILDVDGAVVKQPGGPSR